MEKMRNGDSRNARKQTETKVQKVHEQQHQWLGGSENPNMGGPRQRPMAFIVESCESPCRQAIALRYGEEEKKNW